MKEFIKLKNEAKEGQLKKRGPIEDVPKVPKRPYKELPSFKPRPGEKPHSFMHRVNAVTTNNLKEAQFEAKYSVDVVRDDKGELKVKKRSEEEMLELSGKPSAKGQGEATKKVSGVKKRKERFDKKKLKREKKQKVREELEAEKRQMYKRDDVKFGEICHAPPQLKIIPRRAEKAETVPRPGKKALLLHSLIEKTPNANKLKSKDIGIKVKTGKLNMKGKRKELPMRTREAIEEEQRSVIQQYREMKKIKTNTNVPI